MKKYQIEITETLKRVIPTKANSYEEALKKLENNIMQKKLY